MGLGGAAEGGATAYALVLLSVALLLGGLLVGVVRMVTGRWRPAVLTGAGFGVLLVALPVSAYTSDRAQEQRRATALREALSVVAEPTSTDLSSRACDGSARGWESAESGDGGAPDVLDRMRASLDRAGFRTSRGTVRERPYVLGTRGRASALVQQSPLDVGTGRYRLTVEDGCSRLAAPR